MSEPLFPGYEPTDDGDLGVDARRTRRDRQLIADGWHPLSRLMPGLRLHRDAVRLEGPTDRRESLRCRDCRFAQKGTYHNRVYWKCGWHTSRSAASDLRRWWPACVGFRRKGTT